MAFPLSIKEQPGLAVDGIVTDANGDHWVLFPGDASWRKVTREQMRAALEETMRRFTASLVNATEE